MEPTEIPPRIRAELARMNYSGVWLARTIDMPYSTFQRRMTDPEHWTVVELDKVARALGVSLSALTGANGEAA